MKNEKRQLAGLKAKRAGESFEELFAGMCIRHNIVCVEIPDGAKRVKTNWGFRLIPCTTPFDYLICRDGKSAAIDCKTIEGHRFCYSDITDHQLDSLMQIGNEIPAGYVVWFREDEEVVFFSHEILAGMQPRTSVMAGDGLILGRSFEFDPSRIFEELPSGGQKQLSL